MRTQLETHDTVTDLPSLDQAIGQIAVNLPGATAVFRRLKLDFCCGGKISLKQAAADKGLDAHAVLTELMAIPRDSRLPGLTEPKTLIDHILTRYHAVHRGQLPELIRMAHRVEAVHRENPQVPAGLAELLAAMEQALLSHMDKEERALFPMMQAGGNPFISQPIAMMRSEHADHGTMLATLQTLTNDATPPDGACTTWRALYAGVAQFRDDLMNHIHLENNVLFAQFDATWNAQPEHRS